MRYFFKKTVPILIVLLIAGLVFFGYGYATKNLEAYLSGILKKEFNAKVSVGCIGLGLPLCLELKDVKIADSISIRKVRFYPNPVPFLFKNGILISSVKMIDPVVKIGRGKDKGFVVSDFLKRNEDAKSLNIPVRNLYFSKVHIENGTFIYEGGEKNGLEFVSIKGSIEGPGIYFSRDRAFYFTATGFFKNRDSDFLSPLKINGCIESDNIIKAKLQCNDVKIELLGPIYKKYLSGIIEGGRVDFESAVQVSAANLIAKCSVKGDDIILKKDADRKIDTPLVANFIVLFSFRNRIVKLKNFQSNFLDFILERS